MGAFIITLLITRVARKVVGYDARGSIIAFLIALGITIGVGVFGSSSDTITPLQQLPFIALGYGKFCLAFLIIDLDFAKRLKANPDLLETVGRIKPSPTTAWIPAIVVIVIGAIVSFMLPGASPNWLASAARSSSAPPSQAAAPPAAITWQEVSSTDGLFTVWMPGMATSSSEVQENPTGRPAMRTHLFQVDLVDSTYGLTYVRFEDSQIDPSATIERVLESTRDGMLRAVSAEIIEQRQIDYQGYPALDVVFSVPVSSKTEIGRSRIVLAGRTLYNLLAFGGSDATANRFLNSLLVTATSDAFRLPQRGGTAPP